MLQYVGGVDGGAQPVCLCLDISCSSRRFRLGRFEEWTIAVSVYGRKYQRCPRSSTPIRSELPHIADILGLPSS